MLFLLMAFAPLAYACCARQLEMYGRTPSGVPFQARGIPWGKPYQWATYIKAPVPGVVINYETFGGFHYLKWGPPYNIATDRSQALLIPPWAVASLSLPGLVFIAWSIRQIRKARLLSYRRSRNLCLACGYDLRASPDRCPECGAAKLQ